ncbi:MAG: dockerin type I domain-containing protein [Oscillospiraceae bacterium]|nr:dockerin type I domain-containing protein [Oscillospiraceae bacterium]
MQKLGKTSHTPRIISAIITLTIFISISTFTTLNVSAAETPCGDPNCLQRQDPCTTPADYSCNDYQKLVAFANQGNNLAALGWDLGNPGNWYGVIWSYNGYLGLYEARDINIRDRGLTGVLDVSDFAGLETLNVSMNQLTSINASNVEYLYSLIAVGNQLETLDVSNNPDLKLLQISGNQLETLDVSNNLNLEHLDVGVNQLETLDVSNNVKLQELLLSGNRLTTLDVSNNPDLFLLNVGDNRLTTLDLSSNPLLEFLYANENLLTELDLSDNPLLEILYASNNRLTELDLSNNPALVELQCNQRGSVKYDDSEYEYPIISSIPPGLTSIDLSNNPLLTTVDLSAHQITTLDLSNNTELVRLDASLNQLTYIDVSKSTKLNRLTLAFNRLTGLNISKNTALTNLDVSNNQLAGLDISKNTALTSLIANDNQLTKLNLSNNIGLSFLIVYNNPLTELDVSMLADLFYLDVDGTLLTQLDVSHNADLWALNIENNSFTHIDVSNNPLLSQLRAFNNQLETLDLSNNPLLNMLRVQNNRLTSLTLPVEFTDAFGLMRIDLRYNLFDEETGKTKATIEKLQAAHLAAYDKYVALTLSSPPESQWYFHFNPQKCLDCEQYPCECCEICGFYPCVCIQPEQPPSQPTRMGRNPQNNTNPPPTAAYEKGDVNGDGQITALDALLVLKHVSGKEILTGAALEAADINNDGIITAEDALTILKFVVVQAADTDSIVSAINGYKGEGQESETEKDDATDDDDEEDGSEIITIRDQTMSSLDDRHHTATATIRRVDADSKILIVDIPFLRIQDIVKNLPVFQIKASEASVQTIIAGSANAGQNAVLIRYNNETGKFEVVSSVTVNPYGTAVITIPAAGGYIVVVTQIGDLTFTGTVTAEDSFLLLQALTGNTELTPLQKFLTSSRSDSNFTATDALNILKFVTGMIDVL